MKNRKCTVRSGMSLPLATSQRRPHGLITATGFHNIFCTNSYVIFGIVLQASKYDVNINGIVLCVFFYNVLFIFVGTLPRFHPGNRSQFAHLLLLPIHCWTHFSVLNTPGVPAADSLWDVRPVIGRCRESMASTTLLMAGTN